ncbi:RIKEN cDNA 2810405J04, putative [Brugia malayi]|uniref:BMA-TAG-322 n=1 Tax=Brugia malayi TaxID=6279 RepID=A0A0H5SG43_BRUMA|nr:RIKEN cDNA 2810405J04, putative [Brugia malayi]CRZ22877.1 BMA-TAG-322 [Brugia malayi]VIO88429.1 RIKEN cDNA 2810405J04, putative [Brugia malayi]
MDEKLQEQKRSFIASEIISFGFNIFPSEELEDLQKAGIEDLRFYKLIEWMCNEISSLYGLDETVHGPAGSDNVEFFLLDLSSILSELECPVDALTTGPVVERFRSTENQTKLLDFLIGHMKCARLTALNRLHEEIPEYKSAEVLHLENALVAVGINQLPADITVEQIFSALKDLATKQMDKCKEKPRPLLTASLSDTQWEKIEVLNEKLVQEYRSRILLLLKRLDVTIQSFTWSDRIKKMQDKLHDIYRPRREHIAVTSNVGMDDLLAATSSLLIVDRINNEKERKRTASRLNKILITDRPGDRGGRPSELRAPPPEMPPWIKDRVPDQGGRQRGDYRSDGGYQRGSGGYQGGLGFQYDRNDYQIAGGYGGYGRGGFRIGGRGTGFENQVMRECEEYYNQSHSGRRGSSRRGRGWYDEQRGCR